MVKRTKTKNNGIIYTTIGAVIASAIVISQLFAATVVPGQSIQSAANSAVAGDIITVSPGVYAETVRISKNNLTIRCTQSRQCTVKKFEVWGSGNTIEGFKVTGGTIAGLDVRFQNNVLRDFDIYDIKINSGDANGVILFGTGHIFDNIYIHDIDQYAFGDPHQDCFQTWDVPARGGAASFITISNVLCDMPQAGNFISKAIQGEGGSHDWTIRNLVSIAPMACLFVDEAYNIDISYSTFIGAGINQPQGCKFLKVNTSTAPHDNIMTRNIFQNITSGQAIYETGDAVQSSNNCYWMTSPRNPEPGDVYANPLLLADYRVPANSPCVGMGAFPNVSPATPTKTSTPSRTPTKTYTPTATLTRTSTPTNTPTSFVIITDTVPPSPTRTPTATASPTSTPVCYPVYVGGKLIGNFCP